MEKYFFYVECTLPSKLQDELISVAMEKYECSGVENFSIDEPTVDDILGERSYSGGDIPDAEIFYVENCIETPEQIHKFFFLTNEQACSFTAYLKQNHIQDAVLKQGQVQDWNEEWKKNFRSIKVSDRFKVVPSWEKKELQSDELYIYPGMGFGTGSHETTFLCLSLLTQLPLHQINTCFDFGCGSGILGLATTKLTSMSQVACYDIDEQALKNVEQNIAINEFRSDIFELILPKDYPSFRNKKYEIVFANILLKTLKSESSNILSHLIGGSFLILSGLLRGQDQEIIDHFLSMQTKLKLLKVVYKGDWVAILMEQEK